MIGEVELTCFAWQERMNMPDAEVERIVNAYNGVGVVAMPVSGSAVAPAEEETAPVKPSPLDENG